MGVWVTTSKRVSDTAAGLFCVGLLLTLFPFILTVPCLFSALDRRNISLMLSTFRVRCCCNNFIK